jgi:hypothetical protein
MTTLRQAAQQALEALNFPSMKTQAMLLQRDEAIIALRRALEQTEQEPVAWIQPGLRDWLCVSYEKDSVHTVPVYPHPPAAQRPWQGLTDEEVKDALVSVDAETKRLPPGMTAFARAIEAALRSKNA